ncbi:MAG: septum formation initiator family protein [Clostridia bacterium]|nr:septum formation initiator family protein [Clostridia bacterium]
MDLLREETQVQNYNAETEAQKHNARISENYNRLKNAIASQFAEDVRTDERRADDSRANVNAHEKPTYISPNGGNASTYAQVPTVTEYASQRTAALFTTEKFERMQLPEEQTVAAPVQAAAVRMEAQYSLSLTAKIAIVAFVAVVTVMLSLICVNTYTINAKRANIARLEEQKAVLVEQNAQVQKRIEDAKSEETIREYAESQGMVKSEN